jgi:hypothetical protein
MIALICSHIVAFGLGVIATISTIQYVAKREDKENE